MDLIFDAKARGSSFFNSRMNKTILNMVHSMTMFKKVKLMFWADAILCVGYIKNKCPSHAIKNNIPYEMWYGHIPSVRHLKVFGSTYYALIVRNKEENSIQGVKI